MIGTTVWKNRGVAEPREDTAATSGGEHPAGHGTALRREASLRVVHILRRLARSAWGGTETVVTELASALRDLGVASEICCTRALEDRLNERIHGVPVHRFHYVYPFLVQTAAGRRKLDHKGGNPLAPGLLVHLVRSPASLYHAHAVGRLGAAVRAAARARRRPYVVSLHGGHTEIPVSQVEAMSRTPGMCLDVGRLLYPLLQQRRVLSDAAHILCVGRSEAEATARLYPRVPVTYVPNGVNVDRFAGGEGARFREATGIRGKPLLLCVGRIDSQKSQHVLIQALPLLRQRYPSAIVVLVGTVSEAAYHDRLLREIRELGLEGAVRLLHGIAHDDPLLVDAYAAADVVVLPSLHEPFGVVVLEAWSAGKPVVASRVGGLEGLVEDGRTGLLVAPGDVADFARAAGSLLDDKGRAAAAGEAGRAVARAGYSWAVHARRTFEIYEQVLARARR